MSNPYSYQTIKTSRFQSYNIHHLIQDGECIWIFTGMSTKDVVSTVDGLNSAYAEGYQRGYDEAMKLKKEPLPDESNLVL